MKRAIIGLLLAVLLVAQVAATGAGESTMAAPLSSVGGGPLAPYDPPIDATAVRSFWSGVTEADMTDNLWNELYAEELGINLTYLWSVIGNQYTQRVNLMLASGELPDIMPVNLRQMYQMQEAGQIEDLTAAWDNYASGTLRSALMRDSTIPFDVATIDDQLWGIPEIVPIADGARVLFVRDDWRQKLGLPEPTTMQELYTIMYAFAKEDPDGNGRDDTYGINLSNSLFGNGFELTSFANGYHAYPNTWIQDDTGAIVYGGVQPEMRVVLRELAGLYQDGLIDPEFVVKDENKASEAVIREQVGVFYGVQWAHWIGGAGVDLYIANPESEWRVYPIPSADGTPSRPVAYNRTNNYTVVRRGFQYPEAIVKMDNLIHSMGMDSQPLGYTYDEWEPYWDQWGYALVRPETVHWNMGRWLNTLQAVEAGDASVIDYERYLQVSQYENIAEFLETGAERRVSDNVDEREWTKVRWGWLTSGKVFQTINDEYLEQDRLMIDKLGAYSTPSMLENWATLQAQQLTTYTRIITGEAPIEDFDSFVTNWHALGGRKITAEVNEWYERTF